VDDIIDLMDLLDKKGVLTRSQFAAVNMERTPKYGPEELNICAVVDRQVKADVAIKQITDDLTALRSTAQICSEKEMAAVTLSIGAVNSKLSESLALIQSQFDKLNATCDNYLKSLQSAAPIQSVAHSTSGMEGTPGSTNPSADRSKNVIIFGVPENSSRLVWKSTVADVVNFAVGHVVDIQNSFRIGGKFREDRKRPISISMQISINSKTRAQ